MAFTKTVQYVQNTPVDLGYNDEVSGTLGTVRAEIGFNSGAGRLSLDSGVKAVIASCATENTCVDTWVLEGTEAEINVAINGLSWIPKAYDAANIAQDFLSIDRDVGDEKGEDLFHCNFERSAIDLVVGDFVYALKHPIDQNNNWVQHFEVGLQGDETVDETTLKGPYEVVKIDADNQRIYTMVTSCDGANFTGVESYEWQLQKDTTGTDDVIYGSIVDYAIINPHGDYNLKVEIFDDDVLHDSGNTTLNGSLFVKEPTFTVLPPTEIELPDLPKGDCTPSLNLGEIAQPDNQNVSVQLLMKRATTDPLYDGDPLKNKPSYITDDSYGTFTTVRVDNRISDRPESGEIRWHFYGTPEQCSKALKYVKLQLPEPIQVFEDDVFRDFWVEVRIVNGRSRVYQSRGDGQFPYIFIDQLLLTEPTPDGTCNFNSDTPAQDPNRTCDAEHIYTVVPKSNTGTINYLWELDTTDPVIISSGQGTDVVTIQSTNPNSQVGDVTYNYNLRCTVWDDEGTDNYVVSNSHVHFDIT